MTKLAYFNYQRCKILLPIANRPLQTLNLPNGQRINQVH